METKSENETKWVRVLGLSDLELKVYRIIETEGLISVRDISRNTSMTHPYAVRTIRFAIKKLMGLDYIGRTLSFKDARVRLYYVK